jgi:hypothetical protein
MYDVDEVLKGWDLSAIFAYLVDAVSSIYSCISLLRII